MKISFQPAYGWKISGEIGREKGREGKPVIITFSWLELEASKILLLAVSICC